MPLIHHHPLHLHTMGPFWIYSSLSLGVHQRTCMWHVPRQIISYKSPHSCGNTIKELNGRQNLLFIGSFWWFRDFVDARWNVLDKGGVGMGQWSLHIIVLHGLITVPLLSVNEADWPHLSKSPQKEEQEGVSRPQRTGETHCLCSVAPQSQVVPQLEFYCISLAIKLFNYGMWVEPVPRQSEEGFVFMKTLATDDRRMLSLATWVCLAVAEPSRTNIIPTWH